MKKVKILVLAGAILICFFGIRAIAANAWEKGLEDCYVLATGDNPSKEYRENEFKAGWANTHFWEYYREKQAASGKEADGYTVNGISMEFIPDYYGGAYVNQYGNLVLEVAEEYNKEDFYQSEVYQEILTATKAEPETLVIRFVPVSYKELMRGKQKLIQYVAKEKINMGCGIDDYRNCIEIDINLRDRKKIPFSELLEDVPYKINAGPFRFVDDILRK